MICTKCTKKLTQKRHFIQLRNLHKLINEFGIPTLPKTIEEKIFRNPKVSIKHEKLSRLLKNFNEIDVKKAMPKTEFENIPLPQIEGKNIEEHFSNIAHNLAQPYIKMVEKIIKKIPPRPRNWVLQPGWMKYDIRNYKCYPVECPSDDCLFFDFETLVKHKRIWYLSTKTNSCS